MIWITRVAAAVLVIVPLMALALMRRTNPHWLGHLVEACTLAGILMAWWMWATIELKRQNRPASGETAFPEKCG